MRGFRLLAAGVLLLAAGLAIVNFTEFDPATLFIGGAACAFLGFVNFITPSYSRGPAVSAGDVTDAIDLARLPNYGSTSGDTGSVIHEP